MVYLTGRPVEALDAWLQTAKIDSGSVFRAIDRWGNVSKRALDPQAVNAILKQRVAMAGLEAAEQSRHRSVQQASSYYNSSTRRAGKAARLLP